MDHGPLPIGRDVIEQETLALKALKESLGDSFIQAVQKIKETKGRVIVTGMGKSGHIGTKIASTFSSTGTSAFFVHPGEASHGDLGMISTQDIILALSNSGETKELSDILFFAKRHGIFLIAVTQKKESTLSELANIALIIPSMPEACPNGLAPTTSSTMMLALGDALAVALLKQKAFSKEDFKALHPGGHLGARLKRVSEVMHTAPHVPLISDEALMEEALLVMTNKSFGCVGVVDKANRLIGVITDGDLRRHMSPTLLRDSVVKIMTRNPKIIAPTSLVEEALHKMTGTITSLFVVNDQKEPLGLLHIHDLLRMDLL
ncbi:MAG: KpsF/GutQ family sugar-phosphate isomerase [Alphaproteobacteria bacterium]|nr:KpsF/GutQ family sugar-phosphate isomerase [Alphaproteobacteria bacterium]